MKQIEKQHGYKYDYVFYVKRMMGRDTRNPYPGVYPMPSGKFHVRHAYSGYEKIHIGAFETLDEAIKAKKAFLEKRKLEKEQAKKQELYEKALDAYEKALNDLNYSSANKEYFTGPVLPRGS